MNPNDNVGKYVQWHSGGRKEAKHIREGEIVAYVPPHVAMMAYLHGIEDSELDANDISEFPRYLIRQQRIIKGELARPRWAAPRASVVDESIAFFTHERFGDDKWLHVASAAIAINGMMLLTQRDPRRSDYGNLWEGPGGKVKLGETPQDALKRELREEIGVDCHVADEPLVRLWLKPPMPDVKKHICLTFYEVEIVGRIELREVVGAGWFAPETMDHLPRTPGNKIAAPVLRALCEKSVKTLATIL